MQIQKPEIKEAVVSASYEQFKEKGFKKSSMRVIARIAGVTTSNIYNYFESKAEIYYYLFGPVYDRLIEIIDKKEALFFSKKYSKSVKEDFINEITSFIKDESERFSILLKGSSGTKYADIKANIAEIVEKTVSSYMKELSSKPASKLAAKILAVMYAEGLIEILSKHTKPAKELSKHIDTFLTLVMEGSKGI